MKITRTFAIAMAVALVACVSHAGLFDAIKSVANEAANVADGLNKVSDAVTKAPEAVSSQPQTSPDELARAEHARRQKQGQEAREARIKVQDDQSAVRRKTMQGQQVEAQRSERVQRNVEDTKAFTQYTDKTDMPKCVQDVAAYMRGPVFEAIKRAKELRDKHEDFCRLSGTDPWEDVFEGVDLNSDSGSMLISAFKRWVLCDYDVRKEWKDPPIEIYGRRKCFVVGGEWLQGSWFGGGTLNVAKEGEELEEGCRRILTELEKKVAELEVIRTSFSGASAEYAKRLKDLHEGVKLAAYKDVEFGDSPFGVYEKIKGLATGDSFPDAQPIRGLAWQETCRYVLKDHKLEMGFSRYSENDIPSLVYLRLGFLKAAPSLDDLKGKYEKLGFKYETAKELIGKVWKDPDHTPGHVYEEYNRARVTVLGAAMLANGNMNSREKKEYERDSKIVADIEAKHMEPFYRERVTGKFKGYFIEFVTMGPTVRDGLIENSNADPGLVKSVVLWDLATTNAQIAEHNKAITAKQEQESKAAVEKAKKEKASALDF